MVSFRSWKTLFVACVGILITTVVVGGCFGGGGGVTPTGAVIKGYVTEIDTSSELLPIADLLASGPGVNGASVTLVGTGKVATTNYLGEFTFTNVPPGIYDVLIKKTGWASAIAYEVRVEANKTSEVALRMTKPGGMPIKETTVPTVSLSCPSPVWGTKDISVNASDSVRLSGALLFIDNLCVAEWIAPPANPSFVHGTYSWETLSSGSGWHNGEHTVTAMALDASGNVACRSITVTVDNGTDYWNEPPHPPINVLACAATVHYSVFDLLTDLGSTYMPLSTSSSPASQILSLAKRVHSASSEVKPLGMPAGSDAVGGCVVAWQLSQYSPPATGFKVYRDGEFIGEAPIEEFDVIYPYIEFPPVPMTWLYIDGSPKLSPLTPVSYSVSAYNRSGESQKSSSANTTLMYPIDKVFLGKPNDGNYESYYPQFTWTRVPGAKLYLIMVLDEDYNTMWQGYAYGDESSVYYGDLDRTIPLDPSVPYYNLEYGKAYHWFVIAMDSVPTPPRPLDPYDTTWAPTRISVSASKPRVFHYRYPY